MKENLNLEQNQQMVQRLSPRQVQFVRLLEMSGPEIEEEVRRQLDDNPALEVVDTDQDTQDIDTIISADDTIANDPDDDPADHSRMYQADTEAYMVRQIEEDGPNLYEYLLNQLGEYDMPEMTRKIAMYIIGNIDENGYITRSLTEMADDIEFSTGIEVTYEQMKEAFDMVRSLDPAGICAVDLRDCMLLQLNRIKPMTLTVREAKDIVANYFDLLSKKHYDRLQAQIGIFDKKELESALKLIRSLNPKPASSVAPTRTSLRLSQISPDVSVEYTDDGRFIISLISNLPQLQIERSFSADSNIVQKKGTPKQNQAQAFIRQKRDDAESFISAIKQRSDTLITVTEAIVKLQPEFFESGERSKLRPMILKDVAELTGLDISVISRATASKYVATDTGIYPLKMFFNEAPTEDSDTSSHQIMHAIKDIVDNEDKQHPLSDEAIKDAMNSQGFNVARRTITKYREKMNIPVGRLRKSI